METFIVLLIIFQAVACGCLAAHVADQKGYSSGAWFYIGFFCGIIGLIAAAGLPLKDDARPESNLSRPCPDCFRTIVGKARVCAACGYRLTTREQDEGILAGLKMSDEQREQAVDLILQREDPGRYPLIAAALRFNLRYYQQQSLIEQLLTAGSFEEIEGHLEGVPPEIRAELERRFRGLIQSV